MSSNTILQQDYSSSNPLIASGKMLTDDYYKWYAKLDDLPTPLTDKIQTGLDPRIKFETSEFSQIEKDAEKKILFVSRVNIQSIAEQWLFEPTPSKRQFPISVLPKNPEERQQHVINMYLALYVIKTIKKKNIRNNIEGFWGSGEYCGEKSYRLYCYTNKYQNSIHIVSIKA
ncbi:hypothetical protein Glove_122g27 [Diversispora epigaea]|uniref:Uncharacterized protein n=1 Tax=Diversispora epigaea TaxID=1348612 RepID=A0A397IZE0_9GLOM|nr:hypothetical protein Glove_122g27 [Diversispora epigaea]